MVTRRQATAWAFLALALGASSLFFMLLQVSPFLPDGAVNIPAVALFVLALTVLVFGLSSLVALGLHRRWPGLAGNPNNPQAKGKGNQGKNNRNKKQEPPAGAALRQGMWMAGAAAILAVLALMQELDIILVLITFGLVGLLEAYVQSRTTR
jgi:membrane protein implicated in regulation of membrane protease activity